MKGRYVANTSDPDRSRPDEVHLRELFADLREALDALELGPQTDPETKPQLRSKFNAMELLRRSRMGSRDGYSTSSVPEALGPAGGHSDRIGELAAGNVDIASTGQDPDRVKGAVRTMIRELQSARRALNTAGDLVVRETPPAARPSEPGCRSCSRVTQTEGLNAGKPVWSPIWRGKEGEETGLCHWCYEWWLAHKHELPPVELLELHLRGVRITSKVIANVVGKRMTTRVRKHRRHR